MDAMVFSSFTKEAMSYGAVGSIMERAAKAGVNPARLAAIQARAGRIASRVGGKAGETSQVLKQKPQSWVQRALGSKPKVITAYKHKYPHGSPERRALEEQMTQHGAISAKAGKLKGVARAARDEPSAKVIPIQERALRAVKRAA